MGKMQTLQNKLLKLHLKLERTSSTNALHMDLHLLKFIDIQKVKILCFVNNCLLGQCPLYFRSYFKCRTSSYKLRGTMLFIKRTRTSIGTSSIDVLAPNCGRFRKNFRNTLLNISYKRTVMQYKQINYEIVYDVNYVPNDLETTTRKFSHLV